MADSSLLGSARSACLLTAGASILAASAAAFALVPNHPMAWFVFGSFGLVGLALACNGVRPWLRRACLRMAASTAPDEQPAAAQARFLDDVEHELRTPLAALMLVGENALVSLPPGAPGREAIESMLEEAQHMRELLVQLLTLSRCSTVATEAQNTMADACELTRRCVESLALVAQAKGQKLSMSLHGPLRVRGRTALLRQAVMNLINNAIEHCPEGARISVSARVDRMGRAAVIVQDDGFGIALEHQQRIFRRFERGDAACRRGGSRGLGLSNALLIARCHGGTIELRSAPGRGARFALRLPLEAPVLEEALQPVPAAA